MPCKFSLHDLSEYFLCDIPKNTGFIYWSDFPNVFDGNISEIATRRWWIPLTDMQAAPTLFAISFIFNFCKYMYKTFKCRKHYFFRAEKRKKKQFIYSWNIHRTYIYNFKCLIA